MIQPLVVTPSDDSPPLSVPRKYTNAQHGTCKVGSQFTKTSNGWTIPGDARPASYWSSSTFLNIKFPDNKLSAWGVHFYTGGAQGAGNTFDRRVRAVRCGS